MIKSARMSARVWIQSIPDHFSAAGKELPIVCFLQRGTDAARQGHPLCAEGDVECLTNRMTS